MQVELPSVSLGLLSHHTSFMSKYGNCHASVSKHGTVSSSGALQSCRSTAAVSHLVEQRNLYVAR